jgi:hypothetical protein
VNEPLVILSAEQRRRLHLSHTVWEARHLISTQCSRSIEAARLARALEAVAAHLWPEGAPKKRKTEDEGATGDMGGQSLDGPARGATPPARGLNFSPEGSGETAP